VFVEPVVGFFDIFPLTQGYGLGVVLGYFE